MTCTPHPTHMWLACRVCEVSYKPPRGRQHSNGDGGLYCKLLFNVEDGSFTNTQARGKRKPKAAFQQPPQRIQKHAASQDSQDATTPQQLKLKVNRAGHPCYSCTHGKSDSRPCGKCRPPTKTWLCVSTKQATRVQRPDRPKGLRRCHSCSAWHKELTKCVSSIGTKNNVVRQCRLLWCKSCWPSIVPIGATTNGMQLAHGCPSCNRHHNMHTIQVPVGCREGQLLSSTLPSGQQVQVQVPEGATPGAKLQIPLNLQPNHQCAA